MQSQPSADDKKVWNHVTGTINSMRCRTGRKRRYGYALHQLVVDDGDARPREMLRIRIEITSPYRRRGGATFFEVGASLPVGRGTPRH